ncbi:hypothetical protein [Pararhodobacter zhoushanensis]|uniref:Uncharacterized protein n=1 Tax=Pararhodobacter zhoushanensis TaxID=2479545 RepID=A0ABT3H2R4_9RHOB|nr:hypothetical protein [Pararhodobacter zhoushanensis]MCW1933975.1 hypothetical protein [Pararhodobacter zhoushanensis]
MSDEAKSKKATLTDADIKTSRGIGRRAFLLGTLGGTTALAGCVTTGITDSDVGAYSDPAGGGRGTGYRASGITDSDRGYGADPAGNGRGRRSCTDSDVGPRFTDPVGRGRRC